MDDSKLSPVGRGYRQYIARLNQGEPTQLDGILGRLEKNVRPVSGRQPSISFDIAKAVVTRIFEMELVRKKKVINLTGEQREVLDNITRHFIADPASPYAAHKGLFVYGGYGVGKTFMFRAMQTLCKVAPVPEMEFQEISTKTLVQAFIDYKESGDRNKKNPLLPYQTGNVLLDDLGEERQVVISYTNQERPMDILLSERNIAWDRYGYQTHATSNMGAGEDENELVNQIDKLYGSRIMDRFYDLFEFVLLPGESKRG